MSNRIKQFVVGKSYVQYYAMDTILFVFDKLDEIDFDKIKPKQPRNASEIFEELCNLQMIVNTGRTYRITAKGRACLLRGGFIGAVIRERISYACIFIAAIGSIISICFMIIG